jgi:prepilin-type processing-associated H-X9-DG protein
MSCTNNLKQWGLSLHTYHDAKNELPGLGNSTRRGYSPQLRLTPFIEQVAVFAGLNFDQDLLGAATYAAMTPTWFLDHAVAAAETSLPLARCPSDSSAPARKKTAYSREEGTTIADGGQALESGTISYMVCTGSDYARYRQAGDYWTADDGTGNLNVETKPNGMFYQTSDNRSGLCPAEWGDPPALSGRTLSVVLPITFGEIGDGNSNTMAFAETQICPDITLANTVSVSEAVVQKRHRTHIFSEAPMGTVYSYKTSTTVTSGSIDRIISDNSANIVSGLADGDLGTLDTYLAPNKMPTMVGWRTERGSSWVLNQPAIITFGAFLPPNAKIPSLWNMNEGLFGVFSAHNSVVNTVFADGSVHPVSGSVDLKIWRRAASINDGEAFAGF